MEKQQSIMSTAELSLISNPIMLDVSVSWFLGLLVHNCTGYVFCRSGENGPGVEGPSRPDRVKGP